MANHRTSPFRRSFEYVALVFGLAALAVQAIAPICLFGFPAPLASGGIPIVLCTAHGFQTATLDPDGKPGPVVPAKDGSDGLCQMCTAFHSAPLLAPVVALLLVILLFWSHADQIVASDIVFLRRAYASFITRGPPRFRAALR